MEIRHLQTFVSVVENNGFTRAAEDLGYAQSTITAHIKMLEEELGQSLFDRLGKKIVITSFGRELLPYAREMLKIYREINNISKNAEEVKGELVIGAGESLSIYRLDKILRKYKEKYPKVSIVLKNSTCSDLRKRLYSGEFDVIFTIEPNIQDDNLVIKKLKEEKMVMIYSTKPLNSENIILSEKGCSLRNSFEHYLELNKVKYKNPLEMSSIEAIKRCVINGLGVSVLPLYSIRQELKNNSIKAKDMDEAFDKYCSKIIYHKNKKVFPAMEKFIEIVLEEAKNWN
ncbi:LysR family transcriptional regulator [Clostridium felsineum]|uniref:LysR family transcriptional regulator n=1 Tax=Clostridium felsineum TaxID=36839 RepID=UPI00098CBD45|nr:LysR family transcriptional regulator [Clostridium felsineum]URZ14511.1 HTH-type transcriptional regulator GltR [Clostridium felsineum DSM 794]